MTEHDPTEHLDLDLETDDQPATPRRHPVDVTSLVAGIVVLAVVAVFAFGDPDSLRDQARIAGPLVLLGIGTALLFGSLRR